MGFCSAFGERRDPSEGGLRGWARLGDWPGDEREGGADPRTMGEEDLGSPAGRPSWLARVPCLPGCPLETVLPSGPAAPPGRTRPSLLLSPELPFRSNVRSPSPDLGQAGVGRRPQVGCILGRCLAPQAPHDTSGILRSLPPVRATPVPLVTTARPGQGAWGPQGPEPGQIALWACLGRVSARRDDG